MSELYTGSCRHCGQAVIGRVFDTPELADAWATEHCDCADARALREVEAQILQGCERIRMLFGEGCEQVGFAGPESPESMELLRQLVTAVAYGVLRSGTVTMASGCRGTVCRTGAGKLRVGRSEGRQVKLEV